MYIANGRIGMDAEKGKPTCKNVSVVDYLICSPAVFSYMTHFCIQDYDPMLSDIHCAVSVSFKLANRDRYVPANDHVTQPENLELRRKPSKPKWKPELSSDFKQSLNDADISDIMVALNNLSGPNNGLAEQRDVNNVVDEINSVFCTAARGLNMGASTGKPSGPKKPRIRNQQWYNEACEITRKTMLSLKTSIENYEITQI